MFQFASASTRIITDVDQERSRIFLWLHKPTGGTKPMPANDRHLARPAIMQALSIYGFSPSVMERLEWVPVSSDCGTAHYVVHTEYPLHSGKHRVDLHVRMK